MWSAGQFSRVIWCSARSSGVVRWFMAFAWLVFFLVVLIRCCFLGFLYGGLVASMLSFSFSVFGFVAIVVFGRWCCFDSLRLLFCWFFGWSSFGSWWLAFNVGTCCLFSFCLCVFLFRSCLSLPLPCGES